MDALVGAFVLLTEAEQRLVVSAYRLLGEGAAVAPQVIAAVAGWSPAEVAARLGSWPGVYLDDEGRLVGLWGMACEAVSPHVLRLADRGAVWMWCALDPLFIVPLLVSTATVSSTCPTTGEAIHLRVGADGVQGVEPASTVVSFRMPEGPFDADVRQRFCHFVRFFASPDAAQAWVVEHPGAFWVPVAEAAQVGRRLAAGVFPALSGG
ncbi:MAG: organomercurial lyase [Pseudonocardiaceae bacterium]